MMNALAMCDSVKCLRESRVNGFFVRSSSRWGAILNYSLVKFLRMANAKLHSVMYKTV